jgi:ribonuclease P protein component
MTKTLPDRLKREKDFNLVFKNGKRLYSDSLTLLYYPADQIKVGFVVSKKHGISVKRNKIKRLLRESFRSFVPKIHKNFFFVLLPKIRDDYSFDKFSKDLGYLLKKGDFLDA